MTGSLNPFKFQASELPPSLGPTDEARQYVKVRLAAAFRLLGALGLNMGVAGHLTVRDPVLQDHFWVNAFGQPYASMRPEDLTLVRHSGEVVQGRSINAAAFAIHAEIHRARPDVHCVVHGHPVYGTAWAALGRRLLPINQDVCAVSEDHVVFGEASGLVLELEEGRRIAEALSIRKAAILLNHGLLTVGQTVDEAVWWFILMERSCQIQLLAEAAGTAKVLPDEVAQGIAREIGTPAFGWFQCQPLIETHVAQLQSAGSAA
ncbi:class II aldolase/adducin family protein [Pseudacidovorax intermedius]|uniref:class II aldolase/adducin family protein n=1 Tax=Pseudacidovorax intermedius TaxID=433924 RepID=UPI0026EF71F6|nr:class II aldolase/adducin family protein [Pseudacidovorax intermedius]